MIAPIIITVFMIIYIAIYFGVLIYLFDNIIVRILIGVIPVVFAGVMIFVCIERIKEIRSGEEDDLSKY
ncbi:MAG: hypothetical protein IJO20_01990 [Ruminococcus sp.]|nr:hypothetical protein [Ruminococcus sp.]MBQ7133244.1 hypothetical protein [Ruminococcus sp.]